MRSVARSVLLAVLVFAAARAHASSSLVLTDGQVIKGTEVSRQGDSYLVTMAGGNTVAFPSALVKEVKLEDDPQPAAPPGWDYSGAKTLAGPEVAPQAPSDATKVFGPPSQWPKNAVDTTVVLKDAIDRDKDVMAGSRSTWSKNAVDTTVVLKDAIDRDKDVMAGSRSTWSKNAVDTTVVLKDAIDRDKDVMAGSRSTWSKNAVDTTWKPTDGFGFKPLSFKGGPEAGATDQAAASGSSPWQCAEGFFAKDADRPATDKDNRASSMTVKSIQSPMYASLGLSLYEASGTLDGAKRKAVFTIAGGACRLVGGDADALIGLNLSSDHAMQQDAASLNVAMASRGGSRIPPGVDKVDYALAFISLTDPTVSGSKSASLKLVAKPEELRTIAGSTPGSCTLSKGKRRKEERAANKAFALPKITAGKDGDVVTFFTWSSSGGVVYRDTVVLAHGGVVSAKRDIVASHIGVHQDSPTPR